MAFCSQCGADVLPSEAFCHACGRSVRRHESEDAALFGQPAAQETQESREIEVLPAPLSESSRPLDESDSRVRTFVGEKSTYYLRRWSQHPAGSSGWNWASFFFSLIWLGYRKMYRRAWMLVLGLVVLSLLFEVLAAPTEVQQGFGVAVMLLLGIRGNAWYRQQVDRALLHVRDLQPELASAYLVHRGGTSVPGAVGMALAALLPAMISTVVGPALRGGGGGAVEQVRALHLGDPAVAAISLRQQADRGDSEAAYWLAQLHLAGAIVEQNDSEAVRLIRSAIDLGHVEASMLLGRWLLRGNRIGADHAEGVRLLTAALDAGAMPTSAVLNSLGWAYATGNGTPLDLSRARDLWSRAFEIGGKFAAQNLAWHANRSEQLGEAVRYWRIAATEAGDPDAQFQLYWAYRYGRGVAEDQEQAIYWLQRAARLGNAQAQVSLGYEYDVGRLVAKNDREALRWALRAAYRGDATGMSNAAIVFERWKYYEDAYLFYSLAASKQLTGAAANRDRVSAQLDRAQILQMQRLARDYGEVGSETGKLTIASTGTGVFVAPGLLVTNEHVISACASVAVQTPGGVSASVTVRSADAELDLAILEVDATPGSIITGRLAEFSKDNTVLGESLTVFGYPLSGVLASGGTLTTGTLSATAGLGDDLDRLQFSAPVQPGNSGGAVFDSRGRIVGIVQAVLMPIQRGRELLVPQNVNFAIKGASVVRFLEAGGYVPRTGIGGQTFDQREVAEIARTASAQVLCYGHQIEGQLDQIMR